MKKLFGISLVAVLAVSPMMAMAGQDDPQVPTLATASYVQGAYNAMDARVGTGTELSSDFAPEVNNLTKAVNSLKSDLASVESATSGAVNSISEGSTDGTISVDGTDVAVHGLGSAAYTESSDYASAAQGVKANNAVQSVTEGLTEGKINVDGTDVRVHGLDSAAYANTNDFSDTNLSQLSSNAIAAGNVSVRGTWDYAQNYNGGTIGAALKDLKDDLNDTGDAIGDKATLTTTDKSDLVAAIGEIDTNKLETDLSNVSVAQVAAVGTYDDSTNYAPGTVGDVLKTQRYDTNQAGTHLGATGDMNQLLDANGVRFNNLVDALNAIDSKGIMIVSTWGGSATFHPLEHEPQNNP